jgi:hypothetical protein
MADRPAALAGVPDSKLRQLHSIMTGIPPPASIALQDSNSAQSYSSTSLPDSPSLPMPTSMNLDGNHEQVVQVVPGDVKKRSVPSVPVPCFVEKQKLQNPGIVQDAEKERPERSSAVEQQPTKKPKVSNSSDSVESMSIKRFFPKAIPSLDSDLVKEGRDSMLSQREQSLLKREAELAAKETALKEMESLTLSENQKQIDALISKMDSMRNELDDERQRSTTITISLLREIGQKERVERYQRLVKDNVRVGCVTTRREGHVIREIWEDGEMFRTLKEKQAKLQLEKEELDAEKKILSKMKSNLNSCPPDELYEKRIELMEHEEILNLRLSLYKQELIVFKREDLELNYLKIAHIRFSKLLSEESRSRYNHNPVLNSRYLLLFLIGKGGFSEVYKAYDMQAQCYVALKLHEINPHWSNERKENFVKHAYRENQILQSLDHPRIVKCFDVS